MDPPHELVHHGLVPLAAKARVPPPDVQRVGEQVGVVRPHVEAHGQRLRGVDARDRDVERELAHGDAHPARPLVAEPQDALVVRDHHQADVVVGGMAQHLVHVALLVGVDPEAARPSEDSAVLLAGPPHRRRVDDGQELLEVLEEDAVEKDLVPVLDGGEADVALERVRLAHDVAVGAPHLLFDRSDGGGEEPLEGELPPLLEGEGGRAVVHRVVQEGGALEAHLHVLLPVGAPLPPIGLHAQTSSPGARAAPSPSDALWPRV